MRFHGTSVECSEVIAELDAALGYPRGYTQADVDSGRVVRRGRGPHAPIESIRTETIAEARGVVVDEDGAPVGEERVVDLPPLARAEHRAVVAEARALRVLNRGTHAQLVAEIGGVAAGQIIALRASGRLTSLDDAASALSANARQALVAARLADDEEPGVAAAPVVRGGGR